MVTADPLAPMPSDPGDRPGAISGFALILLFHSLGTAKALNIEAPQVARPARPAGGLGKQRWERGSARGRVRPEDMGRGAGPHSWPGTTTGPGSFSLAFTHC